jgi:hypothetical protein
MSWPLASRTGRTHYTSGLRCRLLSFRIAVLPPRRLALTAAVEAAADIFEQDFPGDYNVNISYGWGTFDNAPSAFLTPGGSAYSLGGETSTSVSYSQLRGWLIVNAASSARSRRLRHYPRAPLRSRTTLILSSSAPRRRKRLALLVGTAVGSTAQSDSTPGTRALLKAGSQRL